ncbi:predicted protein [Chaetoceros tenuissimus]|uniref:Uncharacterized protein n=1 Tax=Chaetoceros tenuissimus TaxID=426638 RepID=A0AAD3CF28_9STRA|nr:predicted protein [Chaetoceros tenuissimus]
MKTNAWKKLLRGRRSKKAKNSIEQSEKELNHKEDETTSYKGTLDDEVRDEQISSESKEETSVKENKVEEIAVDDIPVEETTGADIQQIEDKLDNEDIETSFDSVDVRVINKMSQQSK